MKKIISMIIGAILFAAVCYATSAYVEETISAENSFTDSILSMGNATDDGHLNISLYEINGSDWSSTTATLQRSSDRQAATTDALATWKDVETWTANDETSLTDTERGMYYRIGVKTGAYSSGSILMRLSQ